MHDDQPVLKIGYGTEQNRIALRITTCNTPHIMGIHGDWGSGKTSFMRQLQESLSQLSSELDELDKSSLSGSMHGNIK